MIKLATNINPMVNLVGLESSIKSASVAGFKLLDFTPRSMDEQKELSTLCEKYGTSVYQTHAPDGRYSGIDTETYTKEMIETLNVSSNLGAKYIAVHGELFDYAAMEYTPEAALAYNYEVYAPVVELAEKLNVKIAFENVFPDIFDIRDGKTRFCSKAEDLAALIDKFGSDHVCCCWDTGHAAVAYRNDQPKAIELLGKRIECTHIHDNDLRSDLHLVPYLCKINWNEVIGALQTFGNAEVLCFEEVYERIPLSAMDEYFAFVRRIGETLLTIR